MQRKSDTPRDSTGHGRISSPKCHHALGLVYRWCLASDSRWESMARLGKQWCSAGVMLTPPIHPPHDNACVWVLLVWYLLLVAWLCVHFIVLHCCPLAFPSSRLRVLLSEQTRGMSNHWLSQSSFLVVTLSTANYLSLHCKVVSSLSLLLSLSLSLALSRS